MMCKGDATRSATLVASVSGGLGRPTTALKLRAAL